MTRSCAAIGCTKSSKKAVCREKKISFHSFPLKNAELLRTWLVNIKRDHFTPTKNHLICSEHFEESDFVYQPFTHRRELRKGAVPTLFSFTKPRKKRKRTTYEFG